MAAKRKSKSKSKNGGAAEPKLDVRKPDLEVERPDLEVVGLPAPVELPPTGDDPAPQLAPKTGPPLRDRGGSAAAARGKGTPRARQYAFRRS
jgi:hypothetical protein